MINRFLSERGFDLNSPLLRNSIKVLIIRGVDVGLLVLYTIYLARIMNQEEYGIFMYAWTLLRFLPPILSVGYNQVSMKFGSVYHKQSKNTYLRGLLTTARRIAMISSSSVIAVVFILNISGAISLESGVAEAITLSSFILPLAILLIIHREFQRGINLLIKGMMGFFILRPALAIALTFLASLFVPVSATIAAVCLGLSLLIILPIDVRNIRKEIGPKERTVFEKAKWNEVARPVFIMTFMLAVVNRTDIILLGFLLDMEEVALYAVAMRLAVLVTFLLDAIVLAIAPSLSKRFHDGDMKGIQSEFDLATKILMLVTIPFGLILIFFSKFILSLFGDVFVEASLILIILVVGQVFKACVGPTNVLMTMTNLQKHAAILVSSAAVFNLLVNYIMIMQWGSVGAAIATTISMIIWKLGGLLILNRTLGVKVFWLPNLFGKS